MTDTDRMDWLEKYFKKHRDAWPKVSLNRDEPVIAACHRFATGTCDEPVAMTLRDLVDMCVANQMLNVDAGQRGAE